MKATHVAAQAAIILAMVLFVSWPQFRPVRAQSVWRYAPATAQQPRADDAAKSSDALLVRPASARVGTPRYTPDVREPDVETTQNAGTIKYDPAFYTPEPIAALGGKLNALVGFARTFVNMPIPYAKVLLRNLRTGQVQARATANDKGQFSFLDLDTSLYIVELLGADGSVVASSEMLTLARGDVRQTEVRAAATATLLAATLGNSLTATMPQVTSAALSNDVTRTTAALLPQESAR